MSTIEEIYSSSFNPPTDQPTVITGLPAINADDIVDVRGEYGKLRHRGVISPNNPYRPQLVFASTNADRDALFELAIKWEADRNQDLWQLDVNRQILEEQRRYDDPSARIARDRRAGINSDIAGGSSAGSSGSGSTMPYQAPDTDVTDSNSRFYNYYDNVTSVTSSVGTTIDFIKSVGSLVSGFTLLPSQFRISNAQADLAEGTLDSAKSLARSQASSAEISALNDRIDFVGRLSSFLQPDSDEATVRNLFTSLGVPADSLDSLYGLYNHYKNSDAMQSEYNDRMLRRKESEARNIAYTSNLLNGIYQNEAEAKNLSFQSQFHIQRLQSSLSQLLSSDDNITKSKAIALNNLNSGLHKSDLELQQIIQDAAAFDNYLSFLRNSISFSKKQQKSLLKGRSFSELNPEEQALYLKETDRQFKLFTSGSDSVSSAVSLFNQFIADRYYGQHFIGQDGNFLPTLNYTPVQFINTIFGIDGNKNAIDQGIGSLFVEGINNAQRTFEDIVKDLFK